MNMNTVKQKFRAVRQQFFRRWDRSGRWRIRQIADLNRAQADADRKSRTIRIARFSDGDEGTVLLIHEIAHAVTKQRGHEQPAPGFMNTAG